MRQTTDDYHVDPFAPITISNISEVTEFTEDQQKDHEAWERNTYYTFAFKYCAQAAKVDLKKERYEDPETQTMWNCLRKFDGAFSIFNSEKTRFFKNRDLITAQGGDIFAHLNK
jgi:hypothetical protein